MEAQGRLDNARDAARIEGMADVGLHAPQRAVSISARAVGLDESGNFCIVLVDKAAPMHFQVLDRVGRDSCPLHRLLTRTRNPIGFPIDPNADSVNARVNPIAASFRIRAPAKHNGPGPFTDLPTIALPFEAKGVVSGVTISELLTQQYVFHAARQIDRRDHDRFHVAGFKQKLRHLQASKDRVFLGGHRKGWTRKIP